MKIDIDSIGRIIEISEHTIWVNVEFGQVGHGLMTLAEPFSHLKVGDYVRSVKVKGDKRGMHQTRLTKVRKVTQAMRNKCGAAKFSVFSGKSSLCLYLPTI